MLKNELLVKLPNGAGYFVWPKLWSPFLIFLSQRTLDERDSSRKMNHPSSLLFENVTRDVSGIMKYQQDIALLPNDLVSSNILY